MKYILPLVFLFAANLAVGQKFTYKFKVNGAKEGTEAYLANYFGDQLYYYDTTIVKAGGNFVFERDSIKGGVYAVVLPGSKYFEVILTEENVELETDTTNFVKFMKVKKSDNNKVFYDYFTFINTKTEESKAFRGQKDEASKAKMQAIDAEVKAKQREILEKNKNLFAGKVLGMSVEPVLTEALKNDTNKLTRYLYLKDHFWDNFDLQDERIVRTPVFAKKLNYFFEKMVVQHPDSLCKEAFILIDKIKKETDLFKYVVHKLTYKYETSKIMGMDAVFSCIGKKYYIDDADGNSDAFWLKKEKRKEISDKAKTLWNLRLGINPPDLTLQDPEGKKWVNALDLDADYTILVFWDPGCGHCKKEIPKLKKVYDELKSQGVVVVGVNTELENKDWIKYIEENKLDWINISDNPEINGNPRKYIMEDKVTTLNSLNFRDRYDIFSTPQIFLLDKDKNIRAKKVGVAQLVDILEKQHGFDIKYVPPADKHKDGEDEEEEKH